VNKENPNVSRDESGAKRVRKAVPKLPLDSLKPQKEEKSLNNYYLELFQKNHNMTYVPKSTEEDADL
jgi:hypothetical protein